MANRVTKLEQQVEWLASKLIPKKPFRGPLAKQVRLMEVLMGVQGMAETRKVLLRSGGLPEDIRDMVKVGKSRSEIKDFYWNCERFRKFWQNMEMSEATLDVLIDDTLQGVPK